VNIISRRLIAALLGIPLISGAILQAKPRLHGPMTEDAAINLLLDNLKRDHVYEKRISLDCVSFETEETTRIYFEVAIREKHNAKCGGDPETSPVIDRYRINRASGKLEWNDAVNETWLPYNPAKIR